VYRSEDLAHWLDLELGPSLLRSDTTYRNAIAHAAMFALLDFLQHPVDRELSLDLERDGPTLYSTVVARSPNILRLHLTELMWQTSVEAADAVVTQLDAGGYEPPDIDLRAA
jgi:hypothetical protein